MQLKKLIRPIAATRADVQSLKMENARCVGGFGAGRGDGAEVAQGEGK